MVGKRGDGLSAGGPPGRMEQGRQPQPGWRRSVGRGGRRSAAWGRVLVGPARGEVAGGCWGVMDGVMDKVGA